jgi:hypothetical protein
LFFLRSRDILTGEPAQRKKKLLLSTAGVTGNEFFGARRLSKSLDLYQLVLTRRLALSSLPLKNAGQLTCQRVAC